MGKKKLVFLFLFLSLSAFSQIGNITYFTKDVWFNDTSHFKNSADTADIYIYNNKIYITGDINIDSVIFVKKGTTTALKTNLAGGGGGGGISTLNTLTGSTQTFVIDSSGTNFNISSTGTSHTFNIPSASSTGRGLVNTGGQTWNGVKTFSSTIVGSINGNSATTTKLFSAIGIYGNNFDGSAALTQIIASNYGGTGNGFTKFSGPATSEKTYVLPNSSSTIAVINLNNGFTTGQQTYGAGGLNAGYYVTSTGSGAANYATFELYNDVSAFSQFALMGSGFTTAGVKIASRAILESTSSVGLAIVSNHASGIIRFATGGTTEVGQFDASGRLGIGVTPTAYLHTKAGTTTIASLNIPVGVALTTKIDGAIYRTATDLYIDSGTVEYVIPHGLKGSASLAFGTVLASTTATQNITVTGARIGDAVFMGWDVANVFDNLFFDCYVSSSNTVTIRVTNTHLVNDQVLTTKTCKVFVLK